MSSNTSVGMKSRLNHVARVFEAEPTCVELRLVKAAVVANRLGVLKWITGNPSPSRNPTPSPSLSPRRHTARHCHTNTLPHNPTDTTTQPRHGGQSPQTSSLEPHSERNATVLPPVTWPGAGITSRSRSHARTPSSWPTCSRQSSSTSTGTTRHKPRCGPWQRAPQVSEIDYTKLWCELKICAEFLRKEMIGRTPLLPTNT
jgi:hypothetical protein